MFDRYLICEDGFDNVRQGTEAVGFRIRVRITYYRGVTLSAIEGFSVTVDGEAFPVEKNLFTVRDRSYTFEELEDEAEERWELGEVAQLTVPRPGGLADGPHIVEVLQLLPYLLPACIIRGPGSQDADSSRVNRKRRAINLLHSDYRSDPWYRYVGQTSLTFVLHSSLTFDLFEIVRSEKSEWRKQSLSFPP